MKVHKESENGYTVVEITVALVVIGIMAMFAVRPMKGYLSRLEYRNSCQSIKRVIQAAQSKAMANPNIHIGVYFDLSTNPHRVLTFQDKSNPTSYQYDGVADPAYLAPQPLKRGSSFKILSGYPDEVVFRGDGSAWKSLKVEISNGTLKDTLDVLASTGRVRIGR